MNALDATRKWLREECPLIDKRNRFNANYLGASGVEYTLRTSGESHRQNIVGDDIATHNLVFGKQAKYSGLSRKSVILQVYYRFTPTLCGADFRPDWLRLGGCKYSKLLQYRRGRGSVW